MKFECVVFFDVNYSVGMKFECVIWFNYIVDRLYRLTELEH